MCDVRACVCVRIHACKCTCGPGACVYVRFRTVRARASEREREHACVRAVGIKFVYMIAQHVIIGRFEKFKMASKMSESNENTCTIIQCAP